MANPYYETGPERAGRVRVLFERIARSYDMVNDLQSLGLHRIWKRQMVRLVNLTPGETALDLCCGTGDIARALARKGVLVFGVDFTLEMIEIACRRAKKEQSKSLSFVVADALHLPFIDNRFDVATIAYGLRNLADFSGGLREIHRVVKPGGRLLILDFGVPQNFIWRAFYMSYLGCVVPLLGRFVSGDQQAYAYILESLNHYLTPAGMRRLLEETGWNLLQLKILLGGASTIHLATKPR